MISFLLLLAVIAANIYIIYSTVLCIIDVYKPIENKENEKENNIKEIKQKETKSNVISYTCTNFLLIATILIGEYNLWQV